MKMKRIANNVALQTIGYVISGFTNVYIYVRECGYQKRKRGSMIFAFRRKCRALSSSKSGSRTGCIIGDEVLNVRQFTSVFDAITKDKPTLAGFLRSLPVIEAPWDGAFQERFCVECGADSCDDCPNEQFRNNPEWWLSLPAAEVEQ